MMLSVILWSSAVVSSGTLSHLEPVPTARVRHAARELLRVAHRGARPDQQNHLITARRAASGLVVDRHARLRREVARPLRLARVQRVEELVAGGGGGEVRGPPAAAGAATCLRWEVGVAAGGCAAAGAG